jgi:hypothetical protein
MDMRHVVRAVLFVGALGCGGAATQGSVTVTPQPTPAPTAQPTATGSLPQPIGHPESTAPARPTGIPGTAIRFEGGAGTSMADAIVIRGAHGEGDGVAAEYKYLEMVYGPRNLGYKVQSQSLLSNAGKSYDRLDVEVKGQSLGVYFDITDYFGKF